MEKRIEELYNSIYDVLVPNASYLGLGDDRYYPDPSLFETLMWNIVVAFFVNFLADDIHDRWFSKKEGVKKSELEKIAREVARQIENKQERKLADIALKRAEAEVKKLLIRNGWPRTVAEKDSKKVAENVHKWLRSRKSMNEE